MIALTMWDFVGTLGLGLRLSGLCGFLLAIEIIDLLNLLLGYTLYGMVSIEQFYGKGNQHQPSINSSAVIALTRFLLGDILIGRTYQERTTNL